MPKHEYDYYSGEKSDQFRFLRVPMVFFEDPDYENLGSDEKLLYGSLHAQVDYSRKNGWIDSEGRTYVMRSIESIQKFLKCSEDKARTTLKNLIDFGLIEKKRRGQGKPDLLYVMDFITKKQEKTVSEKNGDCGKDFSEPENNGVLNPEIPGSRVGKFRVQEPENSGVNYNNIYLNNNTKTYHYPIGDDNTTDAQEDVDNSGYDSDVDETEDLIEQIKANIDYYDYAPRYHAEYNNRYEEMFQVIVEEVVGKRKSQVIGGTEYPQSIIKKRFLSLTSSHVEYAMGMIKENTGKIRNIKKYMIATLFNAPTTIDNYYTQLVNHDMHSGEWLDLIRQKNSEDGSRMEAQIKELEQKLEEDAMRRAANE